MAGYSVKLWGRQLFIAVDQLINVLITPCSASAWADETLSSRAYRMDRDGKPWGRFWRPVIDFLFKWQYPNHCEMAYLAERKRTQAPPETR